MSNFDYDLKKLYLLNVRLSQFPSFVRDIDKAIADKNRENMKGGASREEKNGRTL